MGFFDDLSEQVGILTDRAEEFFDDVFVPDEVRRLIERAAKLVSRENYEQALDLLERAREQKNDLYRLHFLLGVCQFHLGRYRDAEKSLSRALEMSEQADAHYYAGLTAEQQSQWSRARRHFARTLSLQDSLPYEAEVFFGLGRAFLELDRPERAARELNRALDRADESSSVDETTIRVFLAEALHQNDRAPEAYEVISDIEIPEDPNVRTLCGRIAADTGALDEASRHFDKALSTHPSYAPALLARGRLERQAGNLDAAEQHLLDALNASPPDRHVEIYEELGRLYEAQHDDEQALRAFEAALQEDDTRTALHLKAARIRLQTDQHPSAEDHFARADRLTASDPQSPEHHLAERGLAACALQDGELAAARRRLDTLASREDPPHPETLWLRARLNLETDDPGQALAAAHAALERIDDDSIEHGDLLYPFDELRTQLHDLRDAATGRLAHEWRLPADLDDSVDVEQTLEALRSFLSSDTRLERFFGRWRSIANRMERPLSVALVGEFNVGKSTLANALLGEEFLPMGILPTTAHTCRIGYGARRACRIIYRDGEHRDSEQQTTPDDPPVRGASGVDRLRSVWRYADVIEVGFQEAARLMEEDADQIHHLEYLFPHPRLRSIELIDTPGFNAQDAHGDVARAVIDDAEAIVWVLDAGQALSMTEFEVIDDIRASRERLVVVLNKLDELAESPDERREAADKLREYLEDKIGDRIAGLFPMSARRILRAAAHKSDGAPADELDETQFNIFTERLEGDIVEKSGRLKTLEARRELASLGRDLADFRRQHLQTYSATVDELHSILSEIEDQAAELTDSLPREIATRVDDQIDFATEAASHDIEEMMRPAESWVEQALGERNLDDTDRSFVSDMLGERIEDVLARARRETARRADLLQNDAIEKLDAALEPLETDESRFVRRRLEAMVDESRAHRVLLEERVFGQIRADIRARLDTAGHEAFERLTGPDLPREDWPDHLRSVLPNLEARLEPALSTWCETFGRLLSRTVRRLAEDVNLLRLEAEAKWDLQPLSKLFTSSLDGCDSPSE